MSKACIGTIVAATIAIGALPAFAQEPAAGAADGARRKQQIVIMEGILVQAVKQGANGVAQQFRTTLQAAQGRGLQPARVEDMVLLSDPEARGFEIPGFGLFFHVSVPGVRSTFVILATQLVAAQRERYRAQAQSVATTSASEAPAPPPVAPVDAGVLSDPDAEYTRQVKAAIMNAILENTYGLRLGPGESLVVAARDDTPVNPLIPTEQSDVSTMTFIVSGADLAAFHERRITAEEALARIRVVE